MWCLFFFCLLHRPHPNECSGSDLDGDIYFVCWDPELIPPATSEPMDYTAEPAQILDHDVTIEVKILFFLFAIWRVNFTYENGFPGNRRVLHELHCQ